MKRNRVALDLYDEEIPEGMRKYLQHYGWHFTRKACEFAIGLIRKKNAATGKMEKVEYMAKEQVDAMLTKAGITLENNYDYDYVFLANLGKATLFKSSVADEQHLAMYVKDIIDNENIGDGEIMRQWDASMTARGIPVDWYEML